MNQLSPYTPEELTEFERLEREKEQTHGLFSASSQWYKFDKYEIIDGRNYDYYIVPANQARMIIYEPFKLFPEILLEYLTLNMRLRNFEDSFNKKDFDISEEAWLKLLNNHHKKRAEIILPFVSKYGLFGLFNYYMIDIRSAYEDSEIIPNKYIVSLKPNSRRLSGLRRSIGMTSNRFFSIDYDKYADYFLPKLSSPYPNIRKSYNERQDFYRNYAEISMDFANWFGNTMIFEHQKYLKELESSKSHPDDLIKSYQAVGKNPVEITYRQKLQIGFGDFSMFFSYDKEKGLWDLRWNFSSLLEALEIMYMMNFVEKMGPRISICQYSKCNKEVLGKKYCCPQHGASARQERCRKRKKEEEIE